MLVRVFNCKLDILVQVFHSKLGGVTSMKLKQIFLLLVIVLAGGALGQGTKSAAAASAPQAQPSQQAPTVASAVEREISAIEKQILEVAEAMPEEKFNFSPESLNTPGSDFKGVRTF